MGKKKVTARVAAMRESGFEVDVDRTAKGLADQYRSRTAPVFHPPLGLANKEKKADAIICPRCSQMMTDAKLGNGDRDVKYCTSCRISIPMPLD